MSWRTLEATGWGIAFVLFTVAGIRAGIPDLTAGPPPPPPTAHGVVPTDAPGLGDATAFVLANNPFRLDRGAGPEPPDPTTDPYLAADPVAARPVLGLVGVVGPPWRALIEGFPGADRQVLVAAGERHGELLVQSVGRNRVVIVGPDTTWILSIGNRWRSERE